MAKTLDLFCHPYVGSIQAISLEPAEWVDKAIYFIRIKGYFVHSQDWLNPNYQLKPTECDKLLPGGEYSYTQYHRVCLQNSYL